MQDPFALILSVLPDFGQVSKILPGDPNSSFRISLLDPREEYWIIKGASVRKALSLCFSPSRKAFSNSKPWGDVSLDFRWQNQLSGEVDILQGLGCLVLFIGIGPYPGQRDKIGLCLENRDLIAFLRGEVILVNGCR